VVLDLAANEAKPEADAGASRAPEGEPESVPSPSAHPSEPHRSVSDDPEALQRIAATLESIAGRSAAQEELIRRLHERVQELQLGETRMLLKPVMAGLVALLGELSMQGRSIVRALSPAEATSLFDAFALRIENTLETLGLEAYRPEVGAPVAARLHKVISVIPTDDAALDGTVAAVLRAGFADPAEPKVAFASQVSAYRFTPPEPAELTVTAGERSDESAADRESLDPDLGTLPTPPASQLDPNTMSPDSQGHETTATEGNPQ